MSVGTTIDVLRATPAAQARVGETLARAFRDDPVLTWITPDPDLRRERLPSLFAAETEAYLRLEETYLVDDGAGAALWAPPGTRAVSDDDADLYGERIATIFQEGFDRVVHVMERMEEHHPDRPCYYLQWMGVVPEHRGRGLGSRLLTSMLARCDAIDQPAYLEATSPANRRLYGRHGFETVAAIALPAGPTLWPMWREPHAATGSH